MEKNLKDGSNFYGVTSLFKIQDKVNKKKLFNQFLIELEYVLDNLTKRKKNEIIKKWSNRTDMFEKRVKINTNKGIISGHAKKIDDECALIIKTKSGNERIFVGDVSLG